MRIMFAAVTVTALLVAGCSTEKPSPEDIFVQQALQSARDSMKDPTSVKFKDVRINTVSKCMYGKVLGKNGMGAYAGYSDFVWSDGEMVIHQKDAIDAVDTLIAKIEATQRCLKSMEGVDHSKIIEIPQA